MAAGSYISPIRAHQKAKGALDAQRVAAVLQGHHQAWFQVAHAEGALLALLMCVGGTYIM